MSCNLSLAMIWQMTYTHKLPKLCSATLKERKTSTPATACPEADADPDPTFYWHPSKLLSSKYQSLTLTIASFVCGMSEIIPSVNIRSTKYLDGNTNFKKHKQSVVVWNILAKRNSNNQAPVVQKVDNAIHRKNHYPLDSAIDLFTDTAAILN